MHRKSPHIRESSKPLFVGFCNSDVPVGAPLSKSHCPWAIKDIADKPRDLLVDRVAVPQIQTQKRIDYLFDNELYELPNEQRPSCHRDKSHSYDTVYGRLRWNRLAQTITSGFTACVWDATFTLISAAP